MISIALIFIFNSMWTFINNIDELALRDDSSLISSEFSYYVDHENNLDIKTLVNQKDSAALFIPSLANDIPYDLGHQSYWIKINMSNNSLSNQNLVLHADNSMLAFFDVYKVNVNLENITAITQQNRNFSKLQC